MIPRPTYAPALFAATLAVVSARADVINLNPVADAFIASAQPSGNFGGAGALAVAAPGLAQGEFQTLVRFDTGAAVSALNASYGAGNWVITAVSLTLTTTAPNNPVFNAQAAGQFALSWMQNDSWVEGTGGPSSPGATGISFSTLPSFLSAGDEALGVFGFGGGTSGTVMCLPGLTTGFTADIGSGNPVSLRLAPADASIAWVFNSRTFGTVSSRPVLSITAVPGPGSFAVFLASLAGWARRRR